MWRAHTGSTLIGSQGKDFFSCVSATRHWRALGNSSTLQQILLSISKCLQISGIRIRPSLRNASSLEKGECETVIFSSVFQVILTLETYVRFTAHPTKQTHYVNITAYCTLRCPGMIRSMSHFDTASAKSKTSMGLRFKMRTCKIGATKRPPEMALKLVTSSRTQSHG